jgi:hypothetical protein
MRDNIILPLQGEDITLYTANISGPRLGRRIIKGEPIAEGYLRIVIGGRGAYVELHPTQILGSNIYLPAHARWRLNNPKVYFEEWRSKDINDIFIYKQVRTVTYADYIPSYWYISPHLLTSEKYPELIN